MKVYLSITELYPVMSLTRLDDADSGNFYQGETEYEIPDELYDMYMASRKIFKEVNAQLKPIYESKLKKRKQSKDSIPGRW